MTDPIRMDWRMSVVLASVNFTGLSSVPLAHLRQLLEASHTVGFQTKDIHVGPCKFTEIYVISGVQAHAVGCFELAWRRAHSHVPYPGQTLAASVVNADSGAYVRQIAVHIHSPSQFAYVHVLFLGHIYGAWAVHVDPLGLVLAVRVEDLDTMVFAICDVDPTV